ncbi:hypothetical protein DFQ30_004637 [Apophysomyces sp. BC1015]|nr:hypothetical protein DFQ30_004637 [Apophysomyces sp. BC1015]KAG0178268.1 hypothetical protein DFQ29_003705 [Apophysomyces sp. BC1021]
MSNSFCLLETLLYEPEEGFYLLDFHITRLLNAAGDFHASDKNIFQKVPTSNEINEALEQHVAKACMASPLRVRLLLGIDGQMQIEHTELSKTFGYDLLDAAAATDDSTFLNVVLDIEPIPCSDDPFLLHKTTRREVYETARKRTECDWHPESGAPFDVVLWNTQYHITETSIANIAVRMKVDDRWIWRTPRLDCGLLAGTFRRQMIEEKQVEEGIISIDDLVRAQKHGDPIICFNSVRKAYRVRLLIREHKTEGQV